MVEFFQFLSSLVWPGVVLWLVGWRYREMIERLAMRIKKIGAAGAELDLPQPNPADPAAPPAIGRPPAGPSGNPVVRHQEESIVQRVNEQAGQNPADRERLLVGVLARTFVDLNHERNYLAIFGSQIAALRHLNSIESLPRGELQRFYDDGRRTDPGFYGDYSFDSWLTFMARSGLIDIDGDRVSISAGGRDFLQYLIANRRPEGKRG